MAKRLFFVFLLLPVFVLADVYSSTNFQVLDPVIDIGGGYSTSSSYSLLQSLGQYMLGTTTATNFSMQSGFLAYPVATSPVLAAVAGAGKANLSWSATLAYVGWRVSGYDVGVSLVSGGPYTYESAGNVLAYEKNGLTAGTMYYFKIKAKDTFGNQIALSNEASATPTSATPTPTPTPASTPVPGGGPPSQGVPVQIIFSGKAYPASEILVLKDAQIVASGRADNNANFQIQAGNFSKGGYVFSVYARDNVGRISRSVTVAAIIGNDVLDVKGIIIPPTLEADKVKVKRGQDIVFSGQSAPLAKVFLFFEPGDFFAKTDVGRDGNYFFRIGTSPFEYGKYSAKAQTELGGLVSKFSHFENFEVGTESEAKPPQKCPPRGDFNGDCRVNLVDFSILMYWFNGRNVPEKVDTNNDGKTDIYDFSVMAYYWTG